MLKGRPQRIDWNKYRTNKFYFGVPNELGAMCGPYALYTLTKHPYKKLRKLAKDGHLGTRQVFQYLRKHGYEIHPITLGNVVEGASRLSNKNILSIDNVILIDQKCFSGENTWTVVYNNIQAHSGDIQPHKPTDFLNYPIQAAYVIWHKKWRMK